MGRVPGGAVVSDTEGMVRVMENAAENAKLAGRALRALQTLNTTEQNAVTQAVAALAYGRAVLQMVAASVSPERRTLVDEMISHLLEGDDEVGYTRWAEREGSYAMSDGELAAVGRYLRAVMLGGES